MKFGEGGKVTAANKPILRSNVTINPMKEGDLYKYLGQDKNLGCIGPVIKERVERVANELYCKEQIISFQQTCSSQRLCCASVNTYIWST